MAIQTQNSSSTTNVTYSPETWFLSSLDSPNETISTEDWPFTNITMDQMTEIRSRIFLAEFRRIIDLYIFFPLYGLGIVGCISIAFILGHKKKKTNFYTATLFISCNDLVFIVFLCSKSIIRALKLSAVNSSDFVLYHAVSSGVAHSLSLFSDLITVCLTIERYVAVAHPIRYKNVSSIMHRNLWLTATGISILIASTRSHFGFSTSTVRNPQVEMSTWFTVVTLLSDSIIPFLITVVTVCLMAGIIRAVVVWRHSGRHASGSSSSSSSGPSSNVLRTLSILFVLCSMFIMNQLSYIGYAVALFLQGRTELTYTHTYDDVELYVVYNQVYTVMAYVGTALELSSRALTFYVYVVFSKEFRKDARAFLRRVVEWCKSRRR